MSDSGRPQRQQPTRLPRPWDSPGKNTGVGCHFLLQCRKVKSESEVAQSRTTLSGPVDCSLPGSSIHGLSRVLEWGAIAFSRWRGQECTKVSTMVLGKQHEHEKSKTQIWKPFLQSMYAQNYLISYSLWGKRLKWVSFLKAQSQSCPEKEPSSMLGVKLEIKGTGYWSGGKVICRQYGHLTITSRKCYVLFRKKWNMTNTLQVVPLSSRLRETNAIMGIMWLYHTWHIESSR